MVVRRSALQRSGDKMRRRLFLSPSACSTDLFLGGSLKINSYPAQQGAGKGFVKGESVPLDPVLVWGPPRVARPVGERRSGGALEGCPMRKRGDPTWSAARDDAQGQKKRPGGEPY